MQVFVPDYGIVPLDDGIQMYLDVEEVQFPRML